MKRFRVVKASQIVFAAAAVLLAAVVIVLAVRYVRGGDGQSTGAVSADCFASEAAQAAFSASVMQIEILPDVTPSGALFVLEDEHSDREVPAPAPKIAPSVLIYHTHTHEAYQPTAEEPYAESYGRWRTEDDEHNVVRVGKALAQALEQEGVRVTHVTTDHEQDAFETAYERSLQTLNEYPGYDLYIDLHRDAYGSDPADAVTVSVGGESAAKVMLLVGTGEGFVTKPDSAANYAFALQLTDAVNARAPGLCRDVLVKSKRYNQHVGRCILLEVGHNLNTLEQALNAVPYVADAIAEMLTEDSAVIALQSK